MTVLSNSSLRTNGAESMSHSDRGDEIQREVAP